MGYDEFDDSLFSRLEDAFNSLAHAEPSPIIQFVRVDLTSCILRRQKLR